VSLQQPYNYHAHRRFLGRKLVNGKCVICGTPTPNQWTRLCSIHKDPKLRCGRCHKKLRLPNAHLCIDCKQKAKEKRNAYYKTPKGRAIQTIYNHSPQGKARAARGQRKYLATPHGHAYANYLHNRRYRELHGLRYLSFEQYLQQIAKVSLDLPTLIAN
jgi:hypothetical protein